MLASKVELDWIFSVHICLLLFLPAYGLHLRALNTGSLFPVGVCFCCHDVGLHFDIVSFKPGSTTYFRACIVLMCFTAVVILHFELCLASIVFVLICLISSELGSDCLFSPATGPVLSSALFLGGLWCLTLLDAQWFLSKQLKGGMTWHLMFLSVFELRTKVKFICGWLACVGLWSLWFKSVALFPEGGVFSLNLNSSADAPSSCANFLRFKSEIGPILAEISHF